MGHLPELLVQVAAHALCGTVGVGHLRVARFQFLQLVHQEIKLLIRNGRLILNVIAMVMLVQFAAKL